MTIRWRADRPSIGRRMFRILTRFSITILIGIGATLAWQSYGDEAKEMVVARAPSLGWLLTAPKTKSPVASATSPDLVQQLAPLALNLDVVRRAVEQLAAKQEQMAQQHYGTAGCRGGNKTEVMSPAPVPAGGLPSHKINPRNPGRRHRLRSRRQRLPSGHLPDNPCVCLIALLSPLDSPRLVDCYGCRPPMSMLMQS